MQPTQWILFWIGTLWVALGTILILYTEKFRKILTSLIGDQNPRLLAILPLIFGVLLVISGWSSDHRWYPLTLGVLGIAKGVYFILGKRETTQSLIMWWLRDASETTCRFWGLVTVVIGIFLIIYI